MSKEEKKLLKNTLRNYTGMNRRIKKNLETLGITVISNKSHYHLLYQGKLYILSKSPSDYRSGLNLVSIMYRDM